MKYKIGDKVRIIKTWGIGPYEMGKIGTIKEHSHTYDNGECTVVVDMGRPRRVGRKQTCWWLNEDYLELAVKPGQQLLFAFMEEK